MAEHMGIVLERSRKPELEELLELLDEMTTAEQEAMLNFAQGVRWAKMQGYTELGKEKLDAAAV